MKHSSYTIRMTNQCHENWNTMDPTELGKFCQQCKRHIPDLTEFSDGDLVNLIRTTEGEFCGRILRSQLNRPIQADRSNKAAFGLPALLAGALMLASIEEADGQVPVEQVSPITPKNTCPTKTPILPKWTRTVDIQVLGPDSLPEAYAIVRIPRLRLEMQCDSNGIAQLIIPEDFHEDQLTIYFDNIGHVGSMYTLKSTAHANKLIIQFEAWEEPMLLGVMVAEPKKLKKK